MLLGSLLAKEGGCYVNRTPERLGDFDLDGKSDTAGVEVHNCIGLHPFISLGNGEGIDFGEEDLASGNIVFKATWEGFQVGGANGIARLFVGQSVRLLDGRSGKIAGFTIVLDKDYKLVNTTAEVAVDSLPHSIDVYLGNLRPKWSAGK